MKTQITALKPKVFIGMDVHKKSWTVHFKTDLFDNKTVTMPADPGTLLNYVEKNFYNHEVSWCYEAGCCDYWIAPRLLEKGWEVAPFNAGLSADYFFYFVTFLKKYPDTLRIPLDEWF